MPSYAPYVIILFDSILCSVISQQLWFRYRVYRKYSQFALVREQVVHKRKDIYRAAICILLSIKIIHSFLWLLYESVSEPTYIRPWYFWVFYGTQLCISVLLKGDFASVVVAIEQNIAKNGRKKAFWRTILMGCAVLCAILTIWGVALSINIQYTPIWQYLGFSTSLLNGFITYKMLTSIITTTKETQASTYHVRGSITAREFEKQIFTLFHMKQMAVGLVFIGLYAAYEFIINLYFMITRDLITQPFIDNAAWYTYSKIVIFNLYIYSMTMIFLMYTWISLAGIREAAMKAKRVGGFAATPDNHENDVIILPDTLEIAYPPNIDPNDPDNQYQPATDTEDAFVNGSRRNSYNPLQPGVPIATETVMLSNLNMAAQPLSPVSSLPVSPPSKYSVMSSTATVRNNEEDDTIDVIPLFGHKISVRHRAESSIATDINVDGFIQESNKKRPHTTMFDMNITLMKKRGCSLERIYFDAQRYRGITPKSLNLTRKMRSISYSNHVTRYHSRRSTINNYAMGGAQTPSVSKKNRIDPPIPRHSKSVPNVYHDLTRARSANDADEEISVNSQIKAVFARASAAADTIKYSNSSDVENSKSVTFKYQLRNHNVEPLNVHDTVNITLPEDAVLTPDKDHHGHILEITMKEPHNCDDNFVIINEETDMYEIANGSNTNVSNGSESIASIDLLNEESDASAVNNGMPDALGFDKVQIYSNSAIMNETK